MRSTVQRGRVDRERPDRQARPGGHAVARASELPILHAAADDARATLTLAPAPLGRRHVSGAGRPGVAVRGGPGAARSPSSTFSSCPWSRPGRRQSARATLLSCTDPPRLSCTRRPWRSSPVINRGGDPGESHSADACPRARSRSSGDGPGMGLILIRRHGTKSCGRARRRGLLAKPVCSSAH